MKPSTLDLFCGAGGLSYGFHLAGFDTTSAIEFDKHACETFKYNFPKANVQNKDILKMTPEETFVEGEFDIVIGGPPCQGFSNIGRPKIISLIKSGKWDHLSLQGEKFFNDPRNSLYKRFIDFVKVIKPKFFLLENVPGLFSFKNSQIAAEILKQFKKLQYDTDVTVLNAAHYGVPQVRKRVFFMGNNGDYGNKFPKQVYYKHKRQKKQYRRQYKTVEQAIMDLPDIENNAGSEMTSYSKSHSNEYQRLMRQGSQNVHNHVSRNTNERDMVAFRKLREGEIYNDLPKEIKDTLPFRQDIFLDRMRRLHKKKPSWTIVAHLYKDGYRYIHPTQDRSITVREAARIQSFPDKFIFKGARTHQFKQVGNAVPPLLAKEIAEQIYNQLN